MTTSQISTFRNVLETRVIEIGRSAIRRDAIRIETSADELDRRLQACERELAVRDLEANSTRLREARGALRRIDEGTYGICGECERAISPARLAAVPWAAFCIRCQELADCRCAAASMRRALPMAA